MSNWHSIEPVQVLKELNTDIHRGLAEEEVKIRIEKYGYNELKKEEKISPFTLFINQFKNILIIILIVAIVLSALVGEVVDAVIIAVIVVFCAVLGCTGGTEEDAFSNDHRIAGRQRRGGSLEGIGSWRYLAPRGRG